MRPTQALIDTNKLRNNYHTIKKVTNNAEVTAIVKANSYGHGMVECAGVLQSEGCRFFGVAIPEEAIKLRQGGIKTDILVVYPVLPDQAYYFCKFDIQASLSNIEFAEELSNMCGKLSNKVKCHLFINTGMNRDGIQPEEAVDYMNYVSRLPGLDIIGCFTHFATSSSDLDFAREQLNIFNNTLESLKIAGHHFQWIHSANTGAIAYLPESHFNMVRPGIALYGGGPDIETAKMLNVEPILTLKSKIILLRRIKEGESVGYDRMFRANKPMTIATVPIGYGDGYLKILTGKSRCIIGGKSFEIAGSVCMDEIMVNIEDSEFQIGDEVIMIGKQKKEEITIYELAEKAGTIPYEITTALSPRILSIYKP